MGASGKLGVDASGKLGVEECGAAAEGRVPLCFETTWHDVNGEENKVMCGRAGDAGCPASYGSLVP